MNNPKEIVELEKIYGITLEEGKPTEFGYIRRNTYAVNENGDVTHLNLSSNQLTEIKGLETLVNLQELDLRINHLARPGNACEFTAIKFIQQSTDRDKRPGNACEFTIFRFIRKSPDRDKRLK
jgi:hypothetical protein